MVKTKISISLDPKVLENAQKSGLNVSGECEHALRTRTQATKKDAPERVLFMKCDGCKGLFEMGYYCQYTDGFLCYTCEREEVTYQHGKTMKYPCKYREDHEHIRIPGFEGQNMEIVQKMAVSGSNELE